MNQNESLTIKYRYICRVETRWNLDKSNYLSILLIIKLSFGPIYSRTNLYTWRSSSSTRSILALRSVSFSFPSKFLVDGKNRDAVVVEIQVCTRLRTSSAGSVNRERHTEGEEGVVCKLTRVMKTQWNYNKPIARLIRSPGRRPFNNKTRTCPPRPRERERARVGSSCMEKRVGERVERGVGRTDAAVRSCRHRRPAARVRTCKRINFSRAFMLADWPNYYGALRSLHARRRYVCASRPFAPTY